MEVTSLCTFCSEDKGGVASSSGNGGDYDANCICICGGGGGGESGGGGGGGGGGERNIEKIEWDQNICGDCICNGGKQQKNGTKTTIGK